MLQAQTAAGNLRTMKLMTRPVGRLLLLLALGSIIVSAGCGQKGPLYLPGDPSEMQPISPASAGEQEDAEATDDEEESESSDDNPGNSR